MSHPYVFRNCFSNEKTWPEMFLSALNAYECNENFSVSELMCQHFSGHVVKQQFAAVRN